MTQVADVQSAIDSAADRYPRAARFTRELLAKGKNLLAPHTEYLINTHGDRFWQRAERLVGLAESIGGSPIDSLIEYTYANLKEQARFMQTQAYAFSDFEDMIKEVYDNPDIMGRFYLEGLLLTHAYWPIHFDLHGVFEEHFLPSVPDRGVGCEFGFGPGLYLLEVLRRYPNTRTYSLDVSQFSIDYARKLLTVGGIDDSRYTLGHGDARKPWPFEDDSMSWGVFAEIIEHVPDPLFSLRELCRCLKPDAPLFATTVVNCNAIDHLYLFTDLQQVRDMLNEAGFDIVVEKAFRVADYARNSQDPSTDVAYVCTPSRT